MVRVVWMVLVGLVASGGLAVVDAGHLNCVPGRADPSTYLAVDLPDGTRYYLEERDNPLGTEPPVPLSGFLLGGGTWLWEETNGLDGLQRGGYNNAVVDLDELYCMLIPCIIHSVDPPTESNCGHGPDLLWF